VTYLVLDANDSGTADTIRLVVLVLTPLVFAAFTAAALRARREGRASGGQPPLPGTTR
jgi:hypothetical protein